MQKTLQGIYSAPQQHWVGDGFPVRSLFHYSQHGTQLSPFLLLDHAGPHHFTPTTKRRGVGQHPHRGFETVTIVYDGEVEHRDSTGAGGIIGPGDVQWMTAASGILHEEFHSHAYAKRGGAFHMVQLWVNLPSGDKTDEPGYQSITAAQIPDIPLARNAGRVRVIAGSYQGNTGPAHTYTPINVWDVRMAAGKSAALRIPDGHTLAVVMLHGSVLINGRDAVRADQVAHLSVEGTQVSLEANNDSMLLVLSGLPIAEPIVGHGPFVMNSEEEIRLAVTDFNSGRFGQIQASTV
ncbi:pirin family protein [Comamonas odontotermitis]|uniref:pirin family protein n=1 Tax=Comamonas odontotermitis TaxID=379895 RepID=UPI0036731CB5